MFLYRTKRRSLSSLGAIIILLLLAIDSFLQQTIDLPERWALQEGTGRLRRTIRYENTRSEVYSDGMPWAMGDRDVMLALDRCFYGEGTRPVETGNGTAPENTGRKYAPQIQGISEHLSWKIMSVLKQHVLAD